MQCIIIATVSQAKTEHITQQAQLLSTSPDEPRLGPVHRGEKNYVYFPICLGSLHSGCTGPLTATQGSRSHTGL